MGDLMQDLLACTGNGYCLSFTLKKYLKSVQWFFPILRVPRTRPPCIVKNRWEDLFFTAAQYIEKKWNLLIYQLQKWGQKWVPGLNSADFEIIWDRLDNADLLNVEIPNLWALLLEYIGVVHWKKFPNQINKHRDSTGIWHRDSICYITPLEIYGSRFFSRIIWPM